MDSFQFLDFIKLFGNNISSLPKHPFRKEWRKEVESIEPHYLGNIPPALEKTFPNEDADVFNYRCETYQAKTMGLLTDAINKLSRLLSMSKHSVSYENDEMKMYVEEKEVNGEPIMQFLLNNFISKRVIDPNAVLLLRPAGEAVENNDTQIRADVSFEFIASKEIVFIDHELRLLIFKSPSKNKYAAPISDSYDIVTDVFYGNIQPKQGSTSELDFNFTNHDLGFVPFVVLGGRAISRDYNGHNFIYYMSDFSGAVAYLNDAATSDNQHNCVVNAVCFPITVYNQGIECPTCNGHGKIHSPTLENPDGFVSCKTCHGTGHIQYTSPLKGVMVAKPVGVTNGNTESPKPVIEFVSPPTDTITTVGEFAKRKFEQAQEALDISKAVKFAQSAVAKIEDKENQYINIKKISDDVYMKINAILYIIQGIVFLDTKSNIVVNAPTSFDIKSEEELFEEYKQMVESGAPDFMRASAFISWLKARYSTDAVGQRIGEICIAYAPGYLLTVEEQQQRYLMGTLKQNDLVRCTFVLSAVTEMYTEDPKSIFIPMEEIKATLDEILAPEFQSTQQEPPQDTILTDL